MINQIYLESAGTHIFCVTRYNSLFSDIKGVVLLLPGFSQSMCDVDYFMSNLSEILTAQGYATIQIDLYGHGDSYGDISELDWDKIKNNILAANKYITQCYPQKSIFAISRGLYSNLLCDITISQYYEQIICVNPVITDINIENYEKYNENIIIELNDLIDNDDFIKNLFVLMGAEVTNLRSQYINLSFIYEVMKRSKNIIYPSNAKILSTYNDEFKIEKNINNKIYDIEYLSNHNFLRDNEWQSSLINKILECLEEKY